MQSSFAFGREKDSRAPVNPLLRPLLKNCTYLLNWRFDKQEL